MFPSGSLNDYRTEKYIKCLDINEMTIYLI
jgi:hypothetical protein